MKQNTSLGSIHETGCSGLVHRDDSEGWDGKGGGREFRMGDTCITMADSCATAAKSLQSCLTLCDPIGGRHQAPPSLGQVESTLNVQYLNCKTT